MVEANPALAPFAKLGGDIFGDKNNLRGPANELVLCRIGIGRDQRQDRRAVRRRYRYPALAGLQAGIKRQIEPQLIQVESQASILIANINVDRVNPEIGITPVHSVGWRRAAHGRDYKSEGD